MARRDATVIRVSAMRRFNSITLQGLESLPDFISIGMDVLPVRVPTHLGEQACKKGISISHLRSRSLLLAIPGTAGANIFRMNDQTSIAQLSICLGILSPQS